MYEEDQKQQVHYRRYLIHASGAQQFTVSLWGVRKEEASLAKDLKSRLEEHKKDMEDCGSRVRAQRASQPLTG